MEILGIGPSELIFIVLIAIIILGPKDMQKAGKSIGHWLNRLIRSDGWRALQRASSEIRNLPTNLMREANIEDLKNVDRELRQSIDPRPRPPTPPPTQNLPPIEEAGTSIQSSTEDTTPPEAPLQESGDELE